MPASCQSRPQWLSNGEFTMKRSPQQALADAQYDRALGFRDRAEDMLDLAFETLHNDIHVHTVHKTAQPRPPPPVAKRPK